MKQSSGTLLMIKPSHFGFNNETAISNAFQNPSFHQHPAQAAIDEFNNVVSVLENQNLKVLVFDDVPSVKTPDAIFPNNWISFHEDGRVVLYPMEAANRRLERREDIIDKLNNELGFLVKEVVSLTDFEKKGQYLEGTGSIVFDHLNKIAFMAISSRSHPEPLNKLTAILGYSSHTFHTSDYSGKSIYHTNVMMSLGSEFAVVCTDCLTDKSEREKLLSQIESNNRTVIEIDGMQMNAFAGNLLEVTNSNGDPILLLSEAAVKSFNSKQIKSLERFCSLLPIPIPTIERIGGGGIRCMVAEVFLPEQLDRKTILISTPRTASDFENYFGLRWRVLRMPWNQPMGSEKDELEESSVHKMAVQSDGTIAGVARLQFNSNVEGQVRFMAVAPEFQGQGVGKKLMASLEAEAKKTGRSRMVLQARENAVPFYLSLGYKIREKTFLLYGQIQHFKMEKVL